MTLSKRPTMNSKTFPCLSAAAVAAALVFAAPEGRAQVKSPPGGMRSSSVAATAGAPPRTPPALGCLIEASAIVEVGASVIGVISSVAVERGDVVKKGQVLATLESNVERAAVQLALAKLRNQAEVSSARAQHDYAQKKASRTAELTDLKFVSPQAREQADTESQLAGMRVTQALEQQTLATQELAMARAQLAQRTLSSPVDGVVAERYMSVGERVENRPVLKLAQIDPLRVEVVLPASQFGTLKVGMSARIQPELVGLAPQKATVAIVDRVIDAASNTFRVRLNLPNPDLGLPSGVRCKVEFASPGAL